MVYKKLVKKIVTDLFFVTEGFFFILLLATKSLSICLPTGGESVTDHRRNNIKMIHSVPFTDYHFLSPIL